MKTFLAVIFCASLAFLIWFSAYLAAIRIYQVDECQNIYMAKILATRQEKAFFTDASGFTVPLSLLVRGVNRSNDLITGARFVMLEIFWLNIVLIAVATGERLRSFKGLAALFGAAMLAPMWDYGFEVRHDNILLAGLLLLWCTLRVHPQGLQSYFVAGAVCVGLQFVAFKAFVYTVPLSLAFLGFPPKEHNTVRWKLILAWAVGGVLTVLAIRWAYGRAGLWDVYMADLRGISAVSVHTARFGPWITLQRLLTQTPLLLALLVAGLTALVADLVRRGKSVFTWDGNFPEGILFLGVTGVLLVNPNPFPYNLLHLVPYAFVFTFRYAVGLTKDFQDRRALLPLVGAVCIFAYVVPFGLATRRHLDWTNGHQGHLMSLTETLTDPQKDLVYDAVGMVPTRRSIDFHWFLHSLNIQQFVDGPGPRVRDMLAARPAAVFIPNYRTDWLPKEDHDFINERYVAVSDDFWVLGKVLPPGGGPFEIVHPGRYRISSLEGSDLDGTYPEGWDGMMTPENDGCLTATLDGAAVSAGVVELSAGNHHLQTAADCKSAVVWMGPKLDRLHRQGSGDHRQLFFNWY